MALKVGGATARHQRAKEAEAARIAREAEEHRREQDRDNVYRESNDLSDGKGGDKYSQLTKLENLAAYLTKEAGSTLDKHSELDRAIEFVLVNLRNQFAG